MHEPAVRLAIEAGVEGIRLTSYLMVHEDWEPENIPKRVNGIVGVMRDLAAAYLRDDVKSIDYARRRLLKARKVGREARELMLQQERDDQVADASAIDEDAQA
ncbi:hypothetical protein DEJ25_15295 [Curtobacterium sp. MCPF17_011]|nr:hypothetical protein DEJ25_15295 [Curtobacterium sp. MCPF17_011]